MRRLALAVLAAVSVTLAACGGTKTVTVTSATATPHATAQPDPCPPGRAFAGCASTGTVPKPGARLLSPALQGPRFPDVSSWQGHPDWGAVFRWQRSHGWPTGGFFKLGEYHVDPDAGYNANALKGGQFRAGYWFIRNTGCQHEASLIIATARQLGITHVWNDVEVGEAAGYSPCLLHAERSAGLWAGTYTGPGTWTHDHITGGEPLWDAAYNLSSPTISGLWERPRLLAWQCTDGIFGCVTDVPGIGRDDVSIDKGFAALYRGGGAPPAIGGAYHYERFDPRRRRYGSLTAIERHTAGVWDANRCRQPARRLVCKASARNMMLERGRLLGLHAAGRPWSYGKPASIGARNQQLWHRIEGRRVYRSWKQAA